MTAAAAHGRSRAPATTELALPPSPEAPRAARDHTARFLRARPGTVDVVDAMLVVSELVSNGVRHGRTQVGLRLSLADDVLRIEVRDAGPSLLQESIAAASAAIDPDAEGGRGLMVVASLSAEWGVVPAPDGAAGKLVWAELRA